MIIQVPPSMPYLLKLISKYQALSLETKNQYEHMAYEHIVSDLLKLAEELTKS